MSDQTQAEATKPKPKQKPAPSRDGKTTVGGYYTEETHVAAARLCAELQVTKQSLIAKAMNRFRQQIGLPPAFDETPMRVFTHKESKRVRSEGAKVAPSRKARPAFAGWFPVDVAEETRHYASQLGYSQQKALALGLAELFCEHGMDVNIDYSERPRGRRQP